VLTALQGGGQVAGGYGVGCNTWLYIFKLFKLVNFTRMLLKLRSPLKALKVIFNKYIRRYLSKTC